VTLSHPPTGRLPLLFVRPAVTFPTEEHHYPLASTKLYCLVTEAHGCEQIAHRCYLEEDHQRFEPTTFWIASECFIIMPPGYTVDCVTMIAVFEKLYMWLKRAFYMLFLTGHTCTLCLKKHTDVAHYNINPHQPFLVIFGRDVAERVHYRMVICSSTSPN